MNSLATTAAGKLSPAINSTTFYLCAVNPDSPGDPNAIPKPVKIVMSSVRSFGKRRQPKSPIIKITLDFPWIDSQHFYTLRAGTNYGLCAVAADAKVKAADGSVTFCDRFNVYTTFFQSSGETTDHKCSDLQNPACYRDPDPYVFIETEDENGIPEDVAIFWRQ